MNEIQAAQSQCPDLQKDSTDADSLGISGTPGFVIGKVLGDQIDGIRIVGAVPYTVFDSTIKDMLPK